jgi:hypothetical protein
VRNDLQNKYWGKKEMKNSKNLPGQQHVRDCHQPRCIGRLCPSALAPEPPLGPERPPLILRDDCSLSWVRG